MPNIKLIVEYNGLHFAGWQFQPGQRTVEDELRRALEMITREPIRALYASGRTDAGVHARGQVVNFYLREVPDLRRLIVSISHLFRGKIALLAAEIVPDSFHARRDAVKKQYSYRILHRPAPPTFDYGRVWHVAAPLDDALMSTEASALVGEHDFTSFRTAGCSATSPIRTIYESELIRNGSELVYRVVGNGFLRHMVRGIVGTLVARGRGMNPRTMGEILTLRDRRASGQNAPPCGLYLDWVAY